MLGRNLKSDAKINRKEFRNRILGCWTGKNIGGTLGAPFEHSHDFLDLSFYAQDLCGEPTPNDDLDLQLMWLLSVEEKGLYHINERVLSEYWLEHLTAPWAEYGVGSCNQRAGLPPPLSGYCNNDTWKYSNGAWIRSEIWACLFPGSPDQAAEYAWFDACQDHCGDGIYAEMFTAALESVAFIEKDIRKIIQLALARIPAESKVAQTVVMACELYDSGKTLRESRDAIVDFNKDLGWFQAPANVGFVILGLLYGEGDFSKAICCAVNCGDDTDCTGATTGSIMGILLGREGIPSKWIEPIGETIQTVAVDRWHLYAPRTLDELTDRIMKCKAIADLEDPSQIALTDALTEIPQKIYDDLTNLEDCKKYLWTRSSRCVRYDISWGNLYIEYPEQGSFTPGIPGTMTMAYVSAFRDNEVLSVKWRLPESWSMDCGRELMLGVTQGLKGHRSFNLTPGDFDGIVYLELEVRLSGLMRPQIITIPIQRTGAFDAGHDNGFGIEYQQIWRNDLCRQKK